MYYRFENCVLDIVRHELRCDGSVISIEPQVFDLLHLLIAKRDRVLSADEIFKTVWRGRFVSETVLGNRINAARKAIGDDGTQQRLIKTLRRRGFRFIGAVREGTGETNAEVAIAPRKLPLTVVSPTIDDRDDELVCIAKALADELTVALVRSRSFDVIARNCDCPQVVELESGASYSVILGLRRASDRLRLTVRLINDRVGLHVWARSYALQPKAGFVEQDAITAEISAAIEPCIFEAEARRRREEQSDMLDTGACVARAFALAKFRTPYNYAAAENLLKRAIELDPHTPRAHGVLAYLYGIQVLWGWKQRQSTMPLAFEVARKAIILDEQDPWAHLSMGWAFTQNRQSEEAVEEYRKALAINPYFPMAHTCLGLTLSYLGQNDKAIAALDDRDRLNAPDVFAGQRLSARASVYACAENCGEAIRTAQLAIRQAPDLVSSQQHLVVNCVSVGEMEKARGALKSLSSIRPNCSLNAIAESLPYVRDSDFNRTLEAFHLLGLK